MSCVPTKSEYQRYILQVHRVRESRVEYRTALVNQIHGFLLAYGVVVQRDRQHLQTHSQNC